jgi:hypothetical protein
MVPKELMELGVMVLEEVLELGVMVLEEVLDLGVMVLEEVLELVVMAQGREARQELELLPVSSGKCSYTFWFTTNVFCRIFCCLLSILL